MAKVDGVDELTELALNLHWSWNHAADVLWEGLDKELWASTQNPCVSACVGMWVCVRA